MSKRHHPETDDAFAGWDSDPSSSEDSLWSCSDEEMNAAARAAYKCINKHTRDSYALEMQQYARWLSREGKISSVDRVGNNMQPKFPLVEADVMKYFSWLESRKVKWRNHANPHQKKRLAPSSITSITCAFKDFYRYQLCDFPTGLSQFFSNRHRAYILKIASEKMRGLYPADRNSMGLSAAAYGRLLMCSIKMRPRGNKFPFSTLRHHPLFLKMSQSMCGRGERIVNIRYAFIGVWADAFRCKVPNSKSDQEGLMSYWKLFFANIIDPWWCPVLELAVHCACNTLCGDFEFIFPQSYRNGFRAHFKDFIQNIAEDDVNFMEVCRHQVTVHSCKRTGVMMANSCEAVHWDQAELRADHKIGMNCVYMSGASPDQDAIMGRILSNLPFGTKEFESQMPHFEEAVSAALPMQKLFAGYDRYPPNFRVVMPFLVASLVYHQNHVLQHYHGHPILSSPLFTTQKHLLKDLQTKIHGGNSLRSLLPLTGRSYLGATFAKVSNIEVLVTEMHGKMFENQPNSALGNQSESLPVVAARAATRDADSTRPECDRLKLLVGRMESFFPAPSSKTRVWSIGYVPTSFRIPSGLLVAECFRHWVTGWRFFEGKTLPLRDDGSSQKTVFSKCCAVMKALLGKKPEAQECEEDPEFWFEFLWTRLCNRFRWSKETMWSVSTCYDKLNDQKLKREEACCAAETPTAAQAAAQATAQAEIVGRHARVLIQEAAGAPNGDIDGDTLQVDDVSTGFPIFSGEVECVRCCFCASYLSVDSSRLHDRRRDAYTNIKQHMRQKHKDDTMWVAFQNKMGSMGSMWDPNDVLKLWVRIAPKVPCVKSQPTGHWVYKPAFYPPISTTYGAIGNYCGDLFRDVAHGAGVRVSENCAFMGTFHAGQEVSGVHYDASSNTLFAGNMTNGRRNATTGDVYQLTPGKSCLYTQIVTPDILQ